MAPRTPSIPEIDSVLVAVAMARAIFPEHLVILPSAEKAAADSEYRNPLHVLHVLAVLGLHGRHDGQLQGVLRQAMGKKAKWRPGDSEATMNAHPGTRRWKCADGHCLDYDKHVTIGRGDPVRGCVQIYYRVDERGRVEIPWVGRHRPTVSTTD